MSRRSCLWPLLFALLLTAVVPAPFAQAKRRIEKVILIGPGLKRAVEITDQAFLDSWNSLLGLDVGVDYAQELKPLRQAPRLDTGYDLARYMQDPDGRSYVWDRLRYYPNPAGGPGYTFYIGLEGSEWVFNGQWYQVTPHGEAMMQQVLAPYDRTSIGPPALPATGRAVLPQDWLAGLGGTLIGIGGLMRLWQKKRRRKTSWWRS